MRFTIVMLMIFLAFLVNIYPTDAVDNNCIACHEKQLRETGSSTMQKGPHTSEPNCTACHYNHTKTLTCIACHTGYKKEVKHNLSCVFCHTAEHINMSRLYRIEKEILINCTRDGNCNILLVYKKIY